MAAVGFVALDIQIEGSLGRDDPRCQLANRVWRINPLKGYGDEAS
jgi:hypothetical protein